MKIIAVVPIKLNNERLPSKNTKLLNGKPLLLYCLETLLSVDEIDVCYVYCSNEKIKALLPSRVAFLKRSPELDLPASNFSKIFAEFSSEVKADIYVYAHATAPFVRAQTIKREINAVLGGEYDSAFCAERIQDYLWLNGDAVNFDPVNIPRSQDLPIVYRETSGVYVFTRTVFDIRHSRIGVNPLIVEVGRREAVDINTMNDFYFAEIMLNYCEEEGQHEHS